MPEWLPALLEVAPQIGIAAFLAWLLLRVWDRASTDRGSYEQGLADAQQRYAKALEDARARYQQDIRALEEKVDRLTARIEELNRLLDEERAARRAAQDQAWRTGGETV